MSNGPAGGDFLLRFADCIDEYYRLAMECSPDCTDLGFIIKRGYLELYRRHIGTTLVSTSDYLTRFILDQPEDGGHPKYPSRSEQLIRLLMLLEGRLEMPYILGETAQEVRRKKREENLSYMEAHRAMLEREIAKERVLLRS